MYHWEVYSEHIPVEQKQDKNMKMTQWRLLGVQDLIMIQECPSRMPPWFFDLTFFLNFCIFSFILQQINLEMVRNDYSSQKNKFYFCYERHIFETFESILP